MHLLGATTEPNSYMGNCCTRAPPVPSPADLRWKKLLLKLYPVRFLQRVWGHLGLYLQLYGDTTRTLLKKVLKKHD